MKETSNPLILIGTISAIILAIIWLQASTYSSAPQSGFFENESKKNLNLFPVAPEIHGYTAIINAQTNFSLSQLKGKIILIDFWTYSCINCLRTLPYLNSWYETYKEAGFEIIGVHSPEFEFEKNISNVQTAVKKYQIKYPVVLDNNYAIWQAYQNRYWPRHVLIDQNGLIRATHIGEGRYEETEAQIRQLLREKDSKIRLSKIISTYFNETTDFGKISTPEIYFGYAFARSRLGDMQEFLPNEIVNYSRSKEVQKNMPALQGEWLNNFDSMQLESKHGEIVLKYGAKKVNIVASGKAIIEIELDGTPATHVGSDATSANGKTIIKTEGEQLYEIISSPNYSERTLTLRISNATKFKIYTFTFG